MKEEAKKKEKKGEMEEMVKGASPYENYVVSSIGHTRSSIKKELADHQHIGKEVRPYYNVVGNDWWLLLSKEVQ